MKRSNISIQGVNVDLTAPDLKEAKTLEDIKALDIFSHMNDNARSVAEKQLLDELNAEDDDDSEDEGDQENDLAVKGEKLVKGGKPAAAKVAPKTAIMGVDNMKPVPPLPNTGSLGDKP